MKRILALSTFFILLLFSLAHSATYYVYGIGGSDSNDGSAMTTGDGWLTIQKAVDTLTAGDTAYIRVGTYSEALSWASANKGTSGSEITLIHYEGGTVTINGGASPAATITGAGDWYWVFDGLIFSSSHDQTISMAPNAGVSHMTWQNCTFNGHIYMIGTYWLIDDCLAEGGGTVDRWFRCLGGLGTCSYLTIQDTTVQNYLLCGIWFEKGTTDNYVLRCTIDDCNTGADWDNYGHTSQTNGKCNYNIVKNCGNMAIELENTFNTEVKYNWLNDNKWGIDIINYDGTPDYRGTTNNSIIMGNIIETTETCPIKISNAASCKIYNNTVYNYTSASGGCDGGIVVKADSDGWIGNTDIRNNIIYILNSGDYAVHIYNPDQEPTITLDYNLVYNSGHTDVYYLERTTAFYTLMEFQAAFGSWEQNSIQDNPDFTNLGGDDYILTSVSPAIDVGDNTLGASYDDALDPGSSWPDSVTTGDQDDYGAGWEIGAYLFNPGTGIPGPGCAGTFILENAEIH